MSIQALEFSEETTGEIDNFGLGEFVTSASFWSPNRLVSSAWIEHAPFAFWLIDALRPRRVVELGVFRGLSYFAFCQAVAQLGLGAECFGIDTWRGDEHGGFYGEEIFEGVNRHNADHYGDFSRLMRSAFDEVQPHFANNTIDLLHIDGRHFYDDVKHDFEHWLEKLSSAAVVLFHDIEVHERGFGVAQLWKELRHAYPTFAFEHGYGLGVLCAGVEVPAPVRRLCATTPPRMRQAVRTAYARLGRGVAEELALRDLRADISRRATEAKDQLAATEDELAATEAKLAAADARLGTAEAKFVAAEAKLGATEAELGAAEAKLGAAESERESIRREYDLLLRSSFWRFTAPGRWVCRFVPVGLRFKLRRGAELLYWLITVRRTWKRINFLRAWRQHTPSALTSSVAKASAVEAAVVRESSVWRFFDADWYAMRYSEVAASGLTPLEHFLTIGAAKGWDPNPAFDTAWYLARYPDVAASGMTALEHFVRYGACEGREPFAGFDRHFYRLQNGLLDASDLETYEHYLTDRRLKGPSFPVMAAISAATATPAVGDDTTFDATVLGESPVSRFFDADWYATRYPEVAASGLTPLEHFRTIGAAKGWDPNPAFDTAWYLARYPDVAASGMIAVEHFVCYGVREGREPCAGFDWHFCRLQSGLLNASDLETYEHYLTDRRLKGPSLPAVVAIPADAATSAMGDDAALGVERVCIGIVAFRPEARQIHRAVTSAQRALARCGEHLTAEIRVVDHGGTLKTSDLPGGVELISPARNEGFGLGHNRCMQAAFSDGADAYVAANPDGAFHPDCLRSMFAMHCAQQGRALIEAQQFPEEHPKYYDPVSLSTPWASGACLLIPRSLWAQTGGFDPAFFLYCEDVDLSWMALRLGFKVLMCPSALFWHDVSGRAHEDWRWRHMLISGRYLAHKWGDPTFREWTERQLLDGFALKLQELPPLDDLATIADGEGITEFRHGFHFAPVRW
jgi:GT2 family glycosyltransferase